MPDHHLMFLETSVEWLDYITILGYCITIAFLDGEVTEYQDKYTLLLDYAAIFSIETGMNIA